MSKSFAAVRRCLEEKRPLSEIPYICKREARFFGTMRKNIIQMFDELELHKELKLQTSADLFDAHDDLLHTTSLIPFAVLINGKNYTGYNPKIGKNDMLQNYVKEYFEPQAAELQAALMVPLGRTVEEILLEYVNCGFLQRERILFGFPHPSGANGHRVLQFEMNKERMKENLYGFFKRQ